MARLRWMHPPHRPWSSPPKIARRLARYHLLSSSQPRRDASSAAARAPRLPRTAYVALGSNVGDRVSNLERACVEMAKRGIRVRRTSSLWETAPMYVEDQAMFLNGACEVETMLGPLALLDRLQEVENVMGRVRLVDKGPRNIDLDIMLYNDEKMEHDRLVIPHRGLLEREFMLRPLSELGPEKIVDPDKPTSLVRDCLAGLPPPSGPPIRTLTPICRSAAALPLPHPSDSPIRSLGPAASAVAAYGLSPLDPARRTRVMAIVNITPDSFSDGGRHSPVEDPDALRETVRDLARRVPGLVIDVGGQSTRPGATAVSAHEEAGRVIPAIELIRAMDEARHVPISVDTFYSSVAEAAAAAGADMINDISAGTFDREMLPTVARLGMTVILMHSRGTVDTMHEPGAADYGTAGGVVAGVAAGLVERVRAAEAAGVRRWRIILDPGLGFSKTADQSSELLVGLARLRAWPGLENLPWLVGPSKKRFVSWALGLRAGDDDEFDTARAWGTAGAVAGAVAGGADMVRVHDAAEMSLVCKMSDAIWRRG